MEPAGAAGMSEDSLWDAQPDDPFASPLVGWVSPRAGYIGFPEAWLERVLPLISNSAQQLTVTLLIFRHLRWDKAVPVPNAEFELLGINRYAKYRAITALERAGLLAVKRTTGRAVSVRLRWQVPDAPPHTGRGHIREVRKKGR